MMVLLTMSSGLLSCDREPAKQNQNENQTTANKWYLFYATWDEWGRASKNCKGWGLCNFDSCWSCDINDRPGGHRGKVFYNDETGEGTLTIALDFTEEIQAEAIKWQLPFTIDEDIVRDKVTLRKGIYLFEPKVGEHGGYLIDVQVE